MEKITEFSPELLVDLGKYSILSNICEGSFGRVVLVQNNETNEKFAAKLCKDELLDTKQQQRFFSEIYILATATHPAVLRLRGFNIYDFHKFPKPIIMTDYYENKSLQNILNLESRSLAPEDWTSTKKFINIIGIALGMDYLHSKKIIHRDLKPDNILLDSNYYPHIGDFGLSKIMISTNSMSLNPSMSGTFLYMSPESLTEGKISRKGDVFAYSFIVYQLLTMNHELISGKTDFLKMNRIVKGERPKLEYVENKALHPFLSSLWSSNPIERKTFHEIVCYLLELFHSDSNIFYDEIDSEEVEEYLSMFDLKEYEKDIVNTRVTESATEDEETSEIQKEEFHADPSILEKILEYGQKYENGIDVEQDYTTAFHHYKIAADAGNSVAMFRLGKLLLNGYGEEKNPQEAMHYFKMSADAGNSDGMNNYAYMLKQGYSLASDIYKTMNPLKIAKRIYHYPIDTLYKIPALMRGEIIGRDLREATRYLKMSADAGNPVGMYNYGLALKKGEGTPINLEEAARYFKMSADTGNSRAMATYGRMLMKGIGVPKNTEEGEKYMKMATDSQ